MSAWSDAGSATYNVCRRTAPQNWVLRNSLGLSKISGAHRIVSVRALAHDRQLPQRHTMKKFLRPAMVVIIALSLVGTASAATAGQRNAVSKANSYLSISAFSKSGLKQQLKFDGFSSSDAGWAVNHVRVSWKAQAVKKAKSYLD